MSIPVTQPYRPGTAYSAQNQYRACLSPIDTIYFNESSTINLIQLQKKIQTPSIPCTYRKVSVPKRKKSNQIRIFSDTECRPQSHFSTLLQKQLIKKLKGPHRRNVSSDQIIKLRDHRCKAINCLMVACSSLEDSKEIHKNIDKQKQLLKDWSKKMDEVTNSLLKLSDVKQDYIQSIYYFNKTSNEEILQDVLRIKAKRDQGNFTVVRKKKRRNESC